MSWMSSRRNKSWRRTRTSPWQNPMTPANDLAGATHSRTHAEAQWQAQVEELPRQLKIAAKIGWTAASQMNPSLEAKHALQAIKRVARKPWKPTTMPLKAKTTICQPHTFTFNAMSTFWMMRQTATSMQKKIIWWTVQSTVSKNTSHWSHLSDAQFVKWFGYDSCVVFNWHYTGIIAKKLFTEALVDGGYSMLTEEYVTWNTSNGEFVMEKVIKIEKALLPSLWQGDFSCWMQMLCHMATVYMM